MGLPVTIYSSDDAGAPGVITKPSDLIAVLKACLVDGYGNKSPLGWSVSFEDQANAKIVFRNSIADGGTGGAIQVEPTDGDSVGANVSVTAANQITAIDNFINNAGNRYFRTNLPNSKGWIVIGTSRGFYFKQRTWRNVIGENGTSAEYNGSIMLFVGDLDSFAPSDQGCFTLLANNGSGSADSYQRMQFSATSALYCTLYDTDGGNNATTYSAAVPNYHPIYSESLPDADFEVSGAPISFMPVQMAGGNSSSVLAPTCRAIVPGLFLTPFVGFRLRAIPIFINVAGVDYYIDDGAFVSQFLFQCSGEWYV
ncbi:hypothetical protein [Shewanella algae]|uniref:hypothetical protein n=1 Tax=Shewanella algae TaxID=38313 RepID=UPI001AAD1E80|nr:hypothetical protein [Shewanella algae]MBO2563807.1 hypothetical protein [Shewanella algae]